MTVAIIAGMNFDYATNPQPTDFTHEIRLGCRFLPSPSHS